MYRFGAWALKWSLLLPGELHTNFGCLGFFTKVKFLHTFSSMSLAR